MINNNYDNFGNNYNQTRKPDKRIVDILIKELNCNIDAQIADIGAGTGNYTFELAQQGYKINAVEPSFVMINQARKHDNIKWFQSIAEELPFQNNSFNGIFSTLAIHHFTSLDNAFSEIFRVLKPDSNFIIFTFDPRLMEADNWLGEYFPTLVQQAIKSIHPRESLIVKLSFFFGQTIKINDFLLPADLSDLFFASGWKRPWSYLDENFRKNISCFSLSVKSEIEPYLNKLKNDLENKVWDKNYSYINSEQFFNGGYYFIIGRKTCQ